MNEKKHILIGKIGKSVKFKKTVASTGDTEPMIFYSALSKMNPEYEFYFIGPSDINKLSEEEYDILFPNHNVHNAFVKNDQELDWFHGIIDYFNERNIKPDFALCFTGMCSNVNIPNFLKKPDGNYYAPLMAYKNYAAPYIYTFNKLGLPVFMIAEDARYITINAKDLYNKINLVFSQINGKFQNYKHIKSETDHTIVPGDFIETIYSGVEKIHLIGMDEHWIDGIDMDRKVNSKGNHFIVLSNGCGTARINTSGNNSSRLPTYKNWIINNFKGTEYEDTKIYGYWDEEIYDQYPQIINKKIYELHEEIADAKYTLVYSQAPGFVTAKPWETICLGLIPFIHKDYDKFRLLGLPEYLYVNTPQELLQKVRELDADDEKYKALYAECVAKFKPSWYSGKALNNFIFSKIGERIGFTYEKKEGLTPENRIIFHRFEKDVFQADKTK